MNGCTSCLGKRAPVGSNQLVLRFLVATQTKDADELAAQSRAFCLFSFHGSHGIYPC